MTSPGVVTAVACNAPLWVGLAAQSAKPQLSVRVLQRVRRIGDQL
jgi:hypothetical protein